MMNYIYILIRYGKRKKHKFSYVKKRFWFQFVFRIIAGVRYTNEKNIVPSIMCVIQNTLNWSRSEGDLTCFCGDLRYCWRCCVVTADAPAVWLSCDSKVSAETPDVEIVLIATARPRRRWVSVPPAAADAAAAASVSSGSCAGGEEGRRTRQLAALACAVAKRAGDNGVEADEMDADLADDDDEAVAVGCCCSGGRRRLTGDRLGSVRDSNGDDDGGTALLVGLLAASLMR